MAKRKQPRVPTGSQQTDSSSQKDPVEQAVEKSSNHIGLLILAGAFTVIFLVFVGALLAGAVGAVAFPALGIGTVARLGA